MLIQGLKTISVKVISMKNVNDSLGVKIMSDLILEIIYDKYDRESFPDQKILKYKITQR